MRNIKIELNCCEGNGDHNCLGRKCPIYSYAETKLKNEMPWVPTGYGSLYAEPNKEQILTEVKLNLKE